MEALAKRAILVTGAASLRLVTDHADKILCHDRRLARFVTGSNGTMVDVLMAHRRIWDGHKVRVGDFQHGISLCNRANDEQVGPCVAAQQLKCAELAIDKVR